MRREKRRVYLAAGGTGGHLFPAQALAEELVRRGYEVDLLTDERVRDYGKDFPASHVHLIPSASLSLSDPLSLPRRLWRLGIGYLLSRKLIAREKPAAVVGFGGYPSLPPLLAAAHLNIPSIIHEQNAVMGRANRLLATRVNAVAVSFERVVGIPDGARSVVNLTGNPVRGLVLASAKVPYKPFGPKDKIRLLIFGGSQGAKFFSDAMPGVLALLPDALRKRLLVRQQCRAEDLQSVQHAYAEAGVSAALETFFSNLPDMMARSHLVICRSGASTIAELFVLGRPAILVPLPGAIDNDQLNNARSFGTAGGGFLLEQKHAKTVDFARLLQELLEAPERLKEAAAAARRHGRPDAAQRLADLVETTIAA
jgi:UDP-N-acetylglucosamine--N-acetylmuramyl-(pentapeptide) pyrophosphoryl-undecaprenol N-acetylglucosamine transferase